MQNVTREIALEDDDAATGWRGLALLLVISAAAYYAVFDLWAPVWSRLTPEASRKVRTGNYERLFDEGRRRVRAWEQAHAR